MKIRPATASDYDQLCELFDEVDALHREARPDIFRKPNGPPRSSERVSSLINGPASTILVAERGGFLLGLSVVVEQPISANPLHVPRRVAEIVTIAVRGTARRRGDRQVTDRRVSRMGKGTRRGSRGNLRPRLQRRCIERIYRGGLPNVGSSPAVSLAIWRGLGQRRSAGLPLITVIGLSALRLRCRRAARARGHQDCLEYPPQDRQETALIPGKSDNVETGY